jgi:hypothetical protein
MLPSSIGISDLVLKLLFISYDLSKRPYSWEFIHPQFTHLSIIIIDKTMLSITASLIHLIYLNIYLSQILRLDSVFALITHILL